jgi:hypothetical protein
MFVMPGHPRLDDVAARKTWMAGTSPAMTNARNPILQNPGDAGISADFIARTGEICMTIVISQIAPSRPMPMLDACLAL